jgi:hypothetical protein
VKVFYTLKSSTMYFKCLLGIIFLLALQTIYPQYSVEVLNSSLVNENTYEFDIYIKSTGSSFELTSYQCALSFNPSIKDGGTVAFSYLTGTSALSNLPNVSVGVYNDNGTEKLCFASSVGSDIISTVNKKIGRFRLQNSVPFGASTSSITWNFTGNIATILTGSGYADITNPTNFNNLNDPSLMPVELGDFIINIVKNKILLKWETITEVNVSGFEIQRSSITNSNKWEPVGFVNGYGNSSSPKNYEYQDNQIEKSGKYKYRLKTIDIDGSYSLSSVIEAEIEIPQYFNLKQNFPNPFNPSTTIRYSIKSESLVKLTIYNSIGEIVETLVEQQQPSGSYDIVWNAKDLASGIYIYRLVATSSAGNENYAATNKMQLLK